MDVAKIPEVLRVGATGAARCTEVDITTACHRQCTVRRHSPLTACWRSVIHTIRRCWAGISLMNTAANVTVTCASGTFSRLAEGAIKPDELNHAWWSTFWSHTYTDWSQIESPAPQGEVSIHGLNLDWRRFNTTGDRFRRHEVAPLKSSECGTASNHQFYGVFLRLRLLAACGRRSTLSPGTAIRCGTRRKTKQRSPATPPCITT